MDFRSYSAAFHAQNDDILHFGILGMKWGVRRYQNKDGSLTPAGQKRYGSEEYKQKIAKKEIKDAVKELSSLGPYINNKKGPDAREKAIEKSKELKDKLRNNEIIKEKSKDKELNDAKRKRDEEMNNLGKVYLKERYDFNGATNVIRNRDGFKNFNIKNYNKGVQKYYKILNDYAKEQGWKSIEEKIKNQGLGNEDDLFEMVKHKSKELDTAYKKQREASANYQAKLRSLAEDICKDCGIKTKTMNNLYMVMNFIATAESSK